MLRRGRVVTGVLVYLLSTTLLIGQQRTLTVPLTTAPAPAANAESAQPGRPSAPEAQSTDGPPARAARFDTPTGAIAPSAATSLEADYFSGVASSTYPISVPPGRGGMAPQLSLDYRSASGNGWAGAGWDLHPGSIERQTRTGVDYAADRYVYRTSHASETLVNVGTNLFATEIASRFEKFEKRTAADGRPYWVVTDTRGTMREYGTTAESRIANPDKPDEIFAWRLNRVIDTLDNATTLTYSADGNNLYLATIRYTESPGRAAANLITFETEERPDVERSYEVGFEVRTARRLKRILIHAGGHAMPSLLMGYGSSPSEATGRSLLRAITIVSADGTTSLPPTQYRYQGAHLAVTAPARTGPSPNLTVDKQCLTGDFNGDTYTDMACYTGKNGVWQMTLSSATAEWTTTNILGPAPGADASRQCTTGDLNADGRTDLLCYTTNGAQWHRMLGSASGWDSSAILIASKIEMPIYHSCVTGDMNADGRTDLACWKGGNNWEWTLSRGNEWDPPVAVVNGPRVTDVAERCTAADFNADGRTDVACFTSNDNLWYIGYSTGTGWLPPVFVHGPRVAVPIANRCLFGDFNGDRRTDINCFTDASGERDWELYLTTQTGIDARIKYEGPRAFPPVTNRCVVMDFNGDARADVSCYAPQDRGFHTYTFNGEGFQNEGYLVGPEINTTVPQSCAIGDFNGDGKGDLACRPKNEWQLLLSSGGTPDLMSGTTSIFGGATSIEYARAAAMPGTRIPFPMDVVAKSTAEDGTGRKAVTTIAYTGGYYDLPARDFRGFRTARITGPATDGASATAVIRYHQGSSIEPGVDDPAAEGGYMRGRIDRIRILNQVGAVLRETNFRYGPSSGGSASRFNPVIETTTIACENSVCNEETRVVNAYDRFGNITRVEDYGDVSRLDDDVTRVTTFAYNEQKYIVALEAAEEVKEGVPGGRRLAFTQNYFDGSDTCNTASSATVPQRGLITRTARWVADGKPLVEERAEFDAAGNVVCRADPLGNKTTFAYDSSGMFLLATQNALKQRTSLAYYGVDGSPIDRGLYGLSRTVTDPNGAVTTTEWDNFGRQVRVIAPLGAITTWAYANLGNPLQQNIATSRAGLTTTVWLDGFGRTVKTRRPGPEAKFIISTARFDERGLPVRTSLPYFEGDPPAAEASVIYDPLRRPIEERDAAGNRRTICYSSGATDLIDENGHRTRRVVSAGGRLVQVERYAGTYARDCAALPLHGTGVVAPYSIAQYREDSLGRLTHVIDAKGVVTSIEYDGLGRRTRIIDPAVGERNFTFNAAGDTTSWRSPSGTAVHVQYDALHRPVQRDYATAKPLGSGDVVHVYDEAGRNGIGRLTSTRNANASRTLSYDREGHITITDRVLGGKTYREERKYDALGRTVEVIYPNGKRITQTYDGPSVRSVFSGSTTYALYSSYNAAGFAEQVRYGNGTVSTSTYETPGNAECPRATYRLCSTKTMHDNAVVFQASYGYDAKGNVTVAREPSAVRSFIYDEFDRLRGVASSAAGFAANAQYRSNVAGAQFPRDWASLSAPSPQLQLVEGFQYDAADDVAWKWDVGSYEYPAPTAATMNPHAPRKAGAEALVWDRDGNLVSGFGRKSSYNVDGRVVSIDLPRTTGKQRSMRRAAGPPTSYQYEYDSNGARTRESGPRGITTYVGDLAECNSSGTCVNHIFAGPGLVATEAADGTVAYYHRDHQRSVRAMTDRGGSVIGTYGYSSYGDPAGSLSVPGFLPTSVLFGSQPYATDAGLYVFGGRAYDPRLGRFLSPDDVVAVAGSPQYLNRYIYAHDNPVSTIDPDGHIVHFLAGLILGAIVGALTAHFQHADWRQGALFGAISGAFLGLPHDFGLTGAALRAATVVSGFASGGINAAIGGGNIGRGAVSGGLTALASSLAGYGEGKAEGFWMSRPKNVLLSTAKQLARSAAHGAVYGGLHAVATDGDILAGALQGARSQALGTLGNMTIGHVLGLAGSALSGTLGTRRDVGGQFVYDTPVFNFCSDCGGAITFGNVTLVGGRTYEDWAPEERAHTNWQDAALGPAYIPSHAVSLTLGTTIGLFREGNFSGHHKFGALENYMLGDQGYADTHK